MEIALGLGMDVGNSLYACAEQATIGFLVRTFDGLLMIPQFQCEGYYIDLYFPVQRVAVECDEESTHSVGNQRDRERQLLLEQALQCTFVRYRPQRPCFDQAKVVNEVMRALKLV